jgi:outer membrane protein assembly factor BamB
VQRLHALAITTGAEKFGGPVEIQAAVKGRGAGSSGGLIHFNPLHQLPRAALLLTGDNLYLSWGSSCDVDPYHGWLMAYDARTLTQKAAFNASPDAEKSGIWQGDTGPAADADGNVFVVTGNGKFSAFAPGGRDFGDSILKLGLTNGGFSLRDFFTPFNQQELDANDLDLGSGGPLLLPDQPGPHPHLLIAGGKGGGVYIIDRDHMGGYHAGDDSHALQVLRKTQGIYSAPAYWNQHVFFLWSDDVLKDFRLDRGRLSALPVAHGTVRFTDPGATPTVSANGQRDGIVWLLRSKGWRAPDRPAVLYAVDASNVARQLYHSEQNPTRDRAGISLRFNAPTVAGGHVYVGARHELDVYGLLR